MNSKKTGKHNPKKLRLARLSEEDSSDLGDDDLLTAEEMHLKEEEKKIQKHMQKNRNAKTESQAEEWMVSQEKLKRETKRKARASSKDVENSYDDEDDEE